MVYNQKQGDKIFTRCGALTTVAIMLLLFSNSLFAQLPYLVKNSEPLTETWRWRAFDILATKGVRCMTDDHAGNMWFGLDKGIMRYDGYNWTLFDDSPCLKVPVGMLLTTPEGKLFAGSDAGLLVYENDNWQKLFPRSDSLQASISALSIMPDGTILAGTQNGFITIKNNAVSIFTILSTANYFRESHPYARVYIIPDEVLFQRNFGRIDNFFIEKNDLIWVLMSRNNDGKLLKFQLKDTLNQVVHNFLVTEELGGFKLPNRNEVLRTRNNELWVINGFYKSGILRQKNTEWEYLKLSLMFGGDELHTDIMELEDGSLWIGGLGKLFIYKEGQWNVFSTPSLPVPSSRIIFHQARNGQVWIAGKQGYVFRISYNDNRWIKYHGLNFQHRNENGREWYISVDGKVVFHENEKWFAYDASHGLIDAPVRLVSTIKGRVFVAGSHQGIAATAYLDDKAWIKTLHPNLSWGIDPRSVFQSKDESLWFGASVDRQEAQGQISGVLQLINPDDYNLQWRHHTQNDGIVQHNVYGIGQSPDGAMWLGGTNLLKWDGKQWQNLADKEYLNDFVDIVHSRSNLWVGSRYYGVFRFDGKEWTHFTRQDGLPGHTIISVYEENPDKVWVMTDKDIAIYDGQRWFPSMFNEEFQLPREGGEIIVDNLGDVYVNKSLREWKRRAFPYSVVGAEAMEEFWTVRYHRDTMPPKTKIEIYTSKVDRAGNTLISWSGSDLHEETPADQLTYSHRLNNGEWSDFSNQTSTLLTKLKSGRYAFEVRSRDVDLNIEPIPVSISFTVTPPLYKQGWFITLLISLLFLIGLYETRLIRRNQRLSKLSASLSEANLTLKKRQKEVECQKETILKQKEALERKTIILEEKTEEIVSQRDQLKEMVDKVEELSNVKQRFFTNISHEFRTPLTLILGSIERLLTNPEETRKSNLTVAYETIQRNSRRILKLINQILEIRKIERGKITLNPDPGDIVAFTRDILNLFNDLAKIQGIGLHFETGINARIVAFDQDILEKILFNLLSNSFKNTPAGGNIFVRLHQEQRMVKDNDTNETMDLNVTYQEYLVFEVVDTGKGIPENHLPHIFERFYQVTDNAPHRRFDSSGIGLSIVKDFVEIHGGSITVENPAGQGARFVFDIPCIDPETLTESPEAGSDNTRSHLFSEELRSEVENMTRAVAVIEDDPDQSATKLIQPERNEKLMILIVEDEPELREFLREMFEPDFDVIEARNGKIGYEKSLDYQPDIIITDVMMPVMDGYELCKLLNSNLATNHIPVVILTSRSAPESKFEGYQRGADAFIEKPFSAEYLKLRINNLIMTRKRIREKIYRELITQPATIEILSEEDKMIQKIQDILEANISDSDFDVESMSQNFFLSRYHFSRKIKQITGMTPKGILDSYRLNRAKQLLQQNIRVNEVAYMVGFDHPNSFTRTFRKYYNMTPSEFASRNYDFTDDETNCLHLSK